MTSHKETILAMRKDGKTYKEIRTVTGASKGTISYHCGAGQVAKSRDRTRKRRVNPLTKKANSFQNRKTSKSLENRIDHFQRDNQGTEIRVVTFGWREVVRKFGMSTQCYLTGEPVDLNEPRTYSFDHILPVSRGGDNSIDNLGIATKVVNQAKSNLTNEEFVELCKNVLAHHGYEIRKAAREGIEPPCTL